MPLPLLALLSAGFEIFTTGKKIYEEVAGKPSTSTSPEALDTEIKALPADQQAQVNDRIRAETEQYKAETGRLLVEEGEISPELLKILPPDAAAKVALLRMTTRPLLVRRAMHVILLPVYVTIYDAGAMFVNGICRVFGADPKLDLFAEKMFGEGSIYVTMYTWAAPTVAAIVLGYFGLRTKEKNANNGKTDTLTGLVGAVKGVITGFRK